jgi:hypothetical protein
MAEWYGRSGYVYILWCEGSHFYKIGITRQNPQGRMEALQTGCPYKLHLVNFRPVMNAEEVEALLHNWLKGVCEQGEWFNLNGEDLVKLMVLLNCEAEYYDNKLCWMHMVGATDITGLVRSCSGDEFVAEFHRRLEGSDQYITLPGDPDYVGAG